MGLSFMRKNALCGYETIVSHSAKKNGFIENLVVTKFSIKPNEFASDDAELILVATLSMHHGCGDLAPF